nr:haloacid dehalogenase-like hydrolase [Planosporangium flavigriseum]
MHVFDMDGTLLRGSATIEICRHIGHLAAARAIEDGWARGEIDDIEFWDRCMPLWCDLTDADIDRAFHAGEWIEGVAEVLADIAARGEYSAVITQSPQFFVDRMLHWGATTVHGAAVELGGKPGPEWLLSVEDKVRITKSLIDRYGLTTADCVAYGDSTSDVGIFQYLPYTVAVNGNPAIRDLAVASYEGWDLREAYAIGRALLSGRRPAREVKESSVCSGRS